MQLPPPNARAPSQVLKAKFDDIFAATKYTKALDALRKLKSEKTAELKARRRNCRPPRAFWLPSAVPSLVLQRPARYACRLGRFL